MGSYFSCVRDESIMVGDIETGLLHQPVIVWNTEYGYVHNQCIKSYPPSMDKYITMIQNNLVKCSMCMKTI